jgi:hypothetical protein
MTDITREAFEVGLRQRVPAVMMQEFLLARGPSGKYFCDSTERDWAFFRMRYTCDQLFAAVTKVLRIQELVEWLNSKLPRPKP